MIPRVITKIVIDENWTITAHNGGFFFLKQNNDTKAKKWVKLYGGDWDSRMVSDFVISAEKWSV